MKKAQVTIVIIIAVLIIAVVGFTVLNRSSRTSDELESVGEAANLHVISATSFTNYIQDCIEKTTIDAVVKNGLDPFSAAVPIENHIIGLLPVCLDDFSTYRSQGYEIEFGVLQVNTQVNQETVTVHVSYPVKVRNSEQEYVFEKYTYALRRSTYIDYIQNHDTEQIIVSEDNNLILKIAPLTRALDSAGQPISKIGVKLLDKEFSDLDNDVIPGELAFDGLPHGTIFENSNIEYPVELTIYYDDNDVPLGFDESNIRVGYFNSDLGLWVGLPTIVDATANKLVIKTNHFSVYQAVLNCELGPTMTYTTPVVLRNNVVPCDDWSDRDINDIVSLTDNIGLWTAAVPHVLEYGIGDLNQWIPPAIGYGKMPVIYDGDGTDYAFYAKEDLDGTGDNCQENLCRTCEYYYLDFGDGNGDPDETPSLVTLPPVFCIAQSCGELFLGNYGIQDIDLDDSNDIYYNSVVPQAACPSSEYTIDPECNEEYSIDNEQPYTHVCKSLLYYFENTKKIEAVSKDVSVRFRGAGNTCFAGDTGSGLTNEINSALNSDYGEGGRGNEQYNIVPTCDTGMDCEIIGPSSHPAKPTISAGDSDVWIIFRVKAVNEAPDVCFESAATVSIQGVGLTEAQFFCHPDSNNDFEIIKGQCYQCTSIPNGVLAYQLRPMSACVGEISAGDACTTNGLVARIDGDCYQCNSVWSEVPSNLCGRCSNGGLGADPTLPRCLDAEPQPELCNELRSRPGTVAYCTDQCNCGPAPQFGATAYTQDPPLCPNQNAPLCCVCPAAQDNCLPTNNQMDAACVAPGACESTIENDGYNGNVISGSCNNPANPVCCEFNALEENCNFNDPYQGNCVGVGSCNGPYQVNMGTGAWCPNQARPICCRDLAHHDCNGITCNYGTCDYGANPNDDNYICRCNYGPDRSTGEYGDLAVNCPQPPQERQPDTCDHIVINLPSTGILPPGKDPQGQSMACIANCGMEDHEQQTSSYGGCDLTQEGEIVEGYCCGLPEPNIAPINCTDVDIDGVGPIPAGKGRQNDELVCEQSCLGNTNGQTVPYAQNCAPTGGYCCGKPDPNDCTGKVCGQFGTCDPGPNSIDGNYICRCDDGSQRQSADYIENPNELSNCPQGPGERVPNSCTHRQLPGKAPGVDYQDQDMMCEAACGTDGRTQSYDTCDSSAGDLWFCCGKPQLTPENNCNDAGPNHDGKDPQGKDIVCRSDCRESTDGKTFSWGTCNIEGGSYCCGESALQPGDCDGIECHNGTCNPGENPSNGDFICVCDDGTQRSSGYWGRDLALNCPVS